MKPKQQGINRSQRIRIIITLIFMEIAFCFLIYRLFYIQCVKGEELRQIARRQWERDVEILPQRGYIFDTMNRPLAINVKTYSLFADPCLMDAHKRKKVAGVLSNIINVSEEEIVSKISSKKRFVWLRRHLPDQLTDRVGSLKIEGIGLREERKRYYPKGKLASHIIGFVNIDNEGLEGVEKQYEQFIRGKLQIRTIKQDRKGRDLNPVGIDQDRTLEGCDLYLTIDEVIQQIAENSLESACRKWRALGGSVIIMNPKTGEVLAMANYPTYDLNKAFVSDKDSMRNRALIDLYEPGSTFKIVTASALINEGLVKLSEKINCENGIYEMNGRVIHDPEACGCLNLEGILVKSSNIGIVKLAERLGKDKLYKYIRAFGFGEKTGIGIPEMAGLVRPPGNWSSYSMGTIPYGQEISVTALQMLCAMNAIANDGIIIQPRIIKMIKDHGETILETKPREIKRPITKETSRIMRRFLVKAVAEGTGSNAMIDGCTVAGKTGTSQKSKKDGTGYLQGKYTSSFVGFFPAEDPVISMIVVIDEPKGSYYASIVACPVFKDIAVQVSEYLKIGLGINLTANGGAKKYEKSFRFSRQG